MSSSPGACPALTPPPPPAVSLEMSRSLKSAAALGFLGLALAIIGVCGIVSYLTSLRTHEIGIRMTLGANPAQILRMVLRQGLLIVAGGLVLGLISAAGAGHLAVSMLVGVSPTDPLTFGAVSLVLAGIALFACYISARRATKVHPMEALRYEWPASAKTTSATQASLVPERNNRIHFGCPPRRNCAAEDPCDGQHCRYRNKRYGISWLHAY